MTIVPSLADQVSNTIILVSNSHVAKNTDSTYCGIYQKVLLLRRAVLSQKRPFLILWATLQEPLGQAILGFYTWHGRGYLRGLGQLSESHSIDSLRRPFYSSRHSIGSHIQGESV
jgi:hypothetical protein